jgi:aspartyl-tRNA(Asn)/glutamyl-tRNA(Gln) amidotransferase subunit C
MGRKIDAEQVRKVAELSRLEMGDAEIEQFSDQLSSILEYIEKLNELDTDDVEPLAHCLPVHNVFRDDEAGECLSNEQALSNSPASEGNYFKVPKILEDGSNA